MNFQHPKAALLIAATLVLTALAGHAAEPLTTEPITFDPQGTGGTNGILIQSFDWAVNSVLTTEAEGDAPAVPFPQDVPNSVQSYFHSKLQGYLDPDGNAQAMPGLNLDFEITVTSGAGIEGFVSSANPAHFDFNQVDWDTKYDNFFRIYYHTNRNSDALTGDGYADGQLILEGSVETARGVFDADLQASQLLDGFGPDHWGGTTTVPGDGSEAIVIQVLEVDPDFFPDLQRGSLLPYNQSAVLNYNQTNPSRNLDTASATVASEVGNINGISGPDFLQQIDPNNAFVPLETPTACRVTGGGNDTSGILSTSGWDGTVATGSHTVTETIVTVKGKSGKVTVEDIEYTNVYTFGGQAGANTALQPRPKGELEHVNHEGPAGQWSFHMGTASAPPGTEIDIIQCSDPGWCRQARPAPTKQIDFAGIGTFRNIIDFGNLNDGRDCAAKTQLKGKPSERGIGTYNWAEVHIEDHGEPGREGQHTTADPAQCPVEGTGTDAFSAYNGTGSRVDAVVNGTYNSFECKTDNDPSTECPDFYRIRIYCGVEPTFDGDGNLSNFNEIAAQKAYDPIYEVFGYIDGGNWQIHPLTGFDLHRR